MKCDELKAYRNLEGSFNTETQTDTVIAEDYEGNYIEFEEDDEVYLKDEVDAAIAELKAQLESEKASRYAESVDAGMRERRLKRALWLARALRARDKAFEYHFNNNVEMCAKWDNVHLILMAKAEEYK